MPCLNSVTWEGLSGVGVGDEGLNILNNQANMYSKSFLEAILAWLLSDILIKDASDRCSLIYLLKDLCSMLQELSPLNIRVKHFFIWFSFVLSNDKLKPDWQICFFILMTTTDTFTYI